MRLTTRLLLPLVLLGSLLVGTAAAQPLSPPSGPVQAGPADPYGPAAGVGRQPRQHRQMRQRHRLPPAVRAALIARFDRDGDGRLTGRERKHAKRFVMRKRMQRQQRHGGM